MSTTLSRWAIVVAVGLVLLFGAAFAASVQPEDARPSAPTSKTLNDGGGVGGGARVQ
jgi:hypothetical protein